uniref:Uncharacterized protein n=1 Tax=Anguilla anguilla TaxID=7936 RepID=A0A0E9UHY5_ANGAN
MSYNVVPMSLCTGSDPAAGLHLPV